MSDHLTEFVRSALMRVAAGVHSLSARSFKVRHGMQEESVTAKGQEYNYLVNSLAWVAQ